MEPRSSKDVVLDAWSAFATRDPDLVGAVFTPDAEWLAPAGNAAARILGGHHLVGRERIVTFLTEEFPAVFGKETSAQLGPVLAEGDTVVVGMRLTAVLPDGRPYDNDYCLLFTVHDQRIRRVREHLDTRRGLVAFGLVEG
jgi:uncharacterized protein